MAATEPRVWPSEGLTRVPYWIYQDENVYAREQERIYRGATWNFLGWEPSCGDVGDFKDDLCRRHAGVVTRDERAPQLLREPLRAPGRAPVPEGPRQREGDRLRLSQLDLRLAGQFTGSPSGAASRQGGMPEDAQPRARARASFA